MLFLNIFTLMIFVGNLYAKDILAESSPVTPVAIKNFDPTVISGKWYEISRLPTYFARHCLAPVTSEFFVESGEIELKNTCATVSGDKEDFNAIIFLTKENYAGDGRLTATSMPTWLRWTHLGRNDYWVLYLDKDYFLAGTPDSKYLWLFARAESPPLKDVQRILGIAKKQGFDLSQMVFNYPSYYVE